MGCTQSRVESEEVVTRCRDRKQHLRAAVDARHALAVAHRSHAQALKNVGSALSDYADGEAHDDLLRSYSAPVPAGASSSHSSVSAPIATVQPIELPPAPPPPPEHIVQTQPLARSMSTPVLPVPKPKMRDLDNYHDAPSVILEEEDGEEDVESVTTDQETETRERTAASVKTTSSSPMRPPPPPPPAEVKDAHPPPPKPEEPHGMQAQWDFFFGTQDSVVPPTLETELGEPSWMQDTREIEADETPPPEAKQPEPQPVPEAPALVKAAPLPPAQVVEASLPPKPVRRSRNGSAGGGASLSSSSEARKGRLVPVKPQTASLVEILNKLDHHFLEASKSAYEVTKILEAARVHYHSNFVDQRGYVDHSKRIMDVITWNHSFKGIPEAKSAMDDFDDDKWETTLTTILDKMLAWEKKLYHEVKAGEVVKMEYQQKLALLNKKKKRGVNSESLQKTKAAASHLHTKYVVDMQSIESAVSEINHLRDTQLYPRLVDLVNGLEKMWEAMHQNHRSQLKIINELGSFGFSVAVKEISEEHHKRTAQLCAVVDDWQKQFGNLMTYQREYVDSLFNWLKLNLNPIKIDLKENASSAPEEPLPPIKFLLYAWHEHVKKLPVDIAKQAMHRFSEVIRTIMVLQDDELKLKTKCEDTRREYERRKRQFDDWQRKYPERLAGIHADGDGVNNDPFIERGAVVKRLEETLREEENSYRRLCKQVREKSVGSLRTHLPDLFRAMSEFTLASSLMYKNLWSITQSHEQQEFQT